MDIASVTLADSGEKLALALVASSVTPLLMLDAGLVVVAASGSFYDAFGLEPGTVLGQRLSYLGTGEWSAPPLKSLLCSILAGAAEVEVYEMALERSGQPDRTLLLRARRLEYGDTANVRLMLAISDVTEARASEKLKDDLVREKGILLEELQHRVANSLQIIASVLMQNARNVESDETRVHLYEAHNRVMSVAAIQRHLVPSRIGDVELLPYLTDLCHSISASMIRDPEQLSLDVTGDRSTMTADRSVSIGLVVTELVINAIKHAFPRRRKGKILVDYRTEQDAWTLTVRDDGVGIPTGLFSTRPGLGSGIIDAISRQLHASVTRTAAHPGTIVSLAHGSEQVDHRQSIIATSG